MKDELKRCELCGTPVKVVGHTTLHYEPDLEGLEGVMAQVYCLPQHEKKELDSSLLIDIATAIRGWIKGK